MYAYCPEPDKLLISGLFPYRKGQYLYEPPSSRGKTSKVIPPDYLKRIFLLTTLNGKESERMTKIKLTDEEKEMAFYVLHDLINDHDDQFPREEVDRLLEMFYYVANRRD